MGDGTAATRPVEVRRLTAADLDEAGRIFRSSLGVTTPPAGDRYGRYWDVEDSLVAVDGDRLLGVAATFGGELTVPGGAAVPCAVVPSVGVRPDAHGRGIGRALLEQQVADALDRGAATLALNASEVGIYGRYGYGPTSRWWGIETDPRMLAWLPGVPEAAQGSITELDTDDERVDVLPELHRRAFGRWGGEVSRHAGWWWAFLNPIKDEDRPTVAVHRDVDGTVDAAVSFTVTNAFDANGFANVAEIHDSIGLTPAAEALLWRWLLERNLLGKVTAERANPRLPLRWMLADPRRLRTTDDGDAVWVRILDVPRVLGARTTAAVGSVAVRVTDRLVRANDRTWMVHGGDGHLHVEPSEEPPAVTMGVDRLASCAWGYAAASEFAWADRLTVADHDGLATLDALLATPTPSWSSTGF